MAIGNKVVTTSSTEVIAASAQGVSDIILTADDGAVVWLAIGEPAEVGKGIKLDLFNPRFVYHGRLVKELNAIAVGGSVTIPFHYGG